MFRLWRVVFRSRVKLDVLGVEVKMLLQVDAEDDGTEFTYDTAVQEWGDQAACMSFDRRKDATTGRPGTAARATAKRPSGRSRCAATTPWPAESSTRSSSSATSRATRTAAQQATWNRRPPPPGSRVRTTWQELSETNAEFGRRITTKHKPRWDNRN